jgi:hypothetical protein
MTNSSAQARHHFYWLIAITVLTLCSVPSIHASTCTLKMVYKEGGKEPLIKEMPNNEGVYNDLFSEAAARIGCKLEISRFPKIRLMRMLESGESDFYPGSSFSNKRATYLYYVPNGLLTAEYGITNKGIPELKSYEDLKKHSITWLMENESSKIEKAEKYQVMIGKRNYLNLVFVSKYITRAKDHNYFYVADKEIVDYFPQRVGKSLDELGLKVHKKCCEGIKPMYLGFSKKSAHYREIKNTDYDDEKPLSPENVPGSMHPDSIMYKLGKALSDMKEEGRVDEIYQRWFN